MKEFKVGDRVRINDTVTDTGAEREMNKYAGEYAKIIAVTGDDEYHLSADGGKWFWKSRDFKPYTTPSFAAKACRGARYQVGDLVRVRPDLKEGNNKKGKKYVCPAMLKHNGRLYTVLGVGECHQGGYRYDLDTDGERWVWYNRCLETGLDWSVFTAGGVSVRCKTKKAYNRFLQACECRGLIWASKTTPTKLAHYWTKGTDDEWVTYSVENGGIRCGVDEHVPEVVWK